jgi:AmmeMemoRadiSam system protein A
VFVTLRDLRGSLRGCVGHIEPQHETLVQEVAACAVAAALRDTRFRPVTARELPHLRIEISLLSPPEPVSDLRLLDPKRYGVIVSSGTARGVLLPDIPGVTTVDEQLRIAASKAGLASDVPWSVERFEVKKGGETVPLTTTLECSLPCALCRARNSCASVTGRTRTTTAPCRCRTNKPSRSRTWWRER